MPRPGMGFSFSWKVLQKKMDVEKWVLCARMEGEGQTCQAEHKLLTQMKGTLGEKEDRGQDCEECPLSDQGVWTLVCRRRRCRKDSGEGNGMLLWCLLRLASLPLLILIIFVKAAKMKLYVGWTEVSKAGE